MTETAVEVHLPTTQADRVWALVGDFNSTPDWHPAITSSALEEEGATRRVQLVEGGETVEHLLEQDHDRRRYTYEILESGLPVDEYQATLEVHESADDGSTVRWSADYRVKGADVAEAEEMIGGFLQAGLDGIWRLYES